MRMDRRSFLKRTLYGALGMSFGGAAGVLRAVEGAGSKSLNFSLPASADLPAMAIGKGEDTAALTRRVVEAMGGMGRFIRKGDRVVIKPNVSWDCGPELGANTHPEVVAALTAMVLHAGARQVTVIDRTIEEPRRCFQISGIESAVTKAGGAVRFQGERSFTDMTIEGIGAWPVFTALFEADKFINVPVVKHHGLSLMTAAMKNLYGIVNGRRASLHQKIDESIVSLAAFVRPTLVVLDATRVMTRNGPTGGREADLIHPRTVAAGTDQVAMDAYAATLLNLKPEKVGYISLAQARGLGTMRFKDLKTVTVS
ncbi:MAG: DUF362 domain-containing protein [Candidatus Aureabacteria bacterium]|nr:DUF362 domain-containing protein [Candidatus Auribacterota bacterium]